MGAIQREPPHISLQELSDICSHILATKPPIPDRLVFLAKKIASLPTDEEWEALQAKKRLYSKEYYERKRNGD